MKLRKTMDDFIKNLKANENKSIAEVMAFICYNPSIGRVLRKKGVKKFQKMVIPKIKDLYDINTSDQFDNFHNNWVVVFIKKIKTHNNHQCSYGHAQKAINVFLKTYVDWASLPDNKTAKRIRPFLHVPLDRILMKEIKKNYKDTYKSDIRPFYKGKSLFSLVKINRKIYYKWQEFFRKNYQQKPVLHDVAWAIKRMAEK